MIYRLETSARTIGNDRQVYISEAALGVVAAVCMNLMRIMPLSAWKEVASSRHSGAYFRCGVSGRQLRTAVRW